MGLYTGTSTANINLTGDKANFATGANTNRRIDTTGTVNIQAFGASGFTSNFDWTGLNYANVASITEGTATTGLMLDR